MYKNSKSFIQILPLSDDEYLRWSRLLAERLGIIVPKERKLFLQSKIWSRMREVGYSEYEKYWDFINSGIEGNLEWSQLVDRLTVHETSFFRHKPSFDMVADDIKEKLKNKEDFVRYKIWSVSCATGEEAYSLAMQAHEICSAVDKNCYYGVTATDVSKPAIAICNQAIYSSDKLVNVEPIHHKHLDIINKDMFSIKDYIKKRMAFGVFNLLELNKPSNIKYDLIYCQNVLMYFDKKIRVKILDGLVKYLNKNGLLILGHMEINSWAHPKMIRVNKSRTLAFRLR